MKILDFKLATELDKKNQTMQAALLCYYHYKTTDEQIFDMKGIQELFSRNTNNSMVYFGMIMRQLIQKVNLLTRASFVESGITSPD